MPTCFRCERCGHSGGVVNTDLQRRAQQALQEISQHLEHGILAFWLTRSVDPLHGGYLVCFAGDGAPTGDTDKYLLAQTRLVWGFSALARSYPGNSELSEAARQHEHSSMVRGVTAIDRFTADQLVLNVSEAVDPAVFDLYAYSGFIDAVVGARESEAGTVAVRHRTLGELGVSIVGEFLAGLKQEIDSKGKRPLAAESSRGEDAAKNR